MYKIRNIPPLCLLIALARLLTGRLRLSKNCVGIAVRNEEGQTFKVFRNIKTNKSRQAPGSCVFVVSFKFSRLSHRANKVASIIPMLLIAGSPGFIQKMYAVNEANGYWQGMYEWKSPGHLEAYKRSFVLRMMKKRAIKETIKEMEFKDLHLKEYLSNNFVLSM